MTKEHVYRECICGHQESVHLCGPEKKHCMVCECPAFRAKGAPVKVT